MARTLRRPLYNYRPLSLESVSSERSKWNFHSDPEYIRRRNENERRNYRFQTHPSHPVFLFFLVFDSGN
jgi:hypothetical protein